MSKSLTQPNLSQTIYQIEIATSNSCIYDYCCNGRWTMISMKTNKIFPTFPPSRLPIQTVVVQGGRGGFGERKSTLCPPCLAVACPRQTHLCSDLEVGTILVDKAPAGTSPNPRLVGQEGSGGLWSGHEVWGRSKLISSCPYWSLKNTS